MEYIVDFKPIILEEIDYDYLASIEEKIKSKISVTNEEIKYFLDSLCYIARRNVNENMDNFNYKCDTFQVMFYHYFKKINCEFIPCMTQNVITNDIVGHSFSILKLVVDGEEKLFLLDPSYIQFFINKRCQKENYFLASDFSNYVLLSPDPGYFIKEEDKELVDCLLNHGYIEFDENFARIYGDSFLNTKRGFKDFNSYQTILGKIYLNSFLKGNEKIQTSEETLEELGLNLELFQDKIYGKKK